VPDTSALYHAQITWDAGQLVPARVEMAGFTGSGLLWVNTNHDDRGSTLAWVDGTGLFRKAPYAYILSSKFTAADARDVVYTCGANRSQQYQCLAFTPDSIRPLWTLTMPAHQVIGGAALTSGRLYVAMQQGNFYAVGAGE
jgi:outer membrane protein assembly factor BamB